MNSSLIRFGVLCAALLLLAGGALSLQPASDAEMPVAEAKEHAEGAVMQVQYLEIVTPKVQETCEALAAMHGVVFSDPIPEFGNARTADLKGGGRLGVRAPMRATETPVVRPYMLVDDIHAAVKAAENAGATIALPPIPIPGQGTFSIYILGGIEHGLWQN